MRLAAYAGTSAALAAGALIKAFNQRPNYYSATVYLSQSNACILILTNLALVCTISFIYGLQRLLFGRLRPIEVEQLSEKAWYAILDTLLAMPSLRDDVGGWLLIIFVLLLAGKVWSWIAEGRVDILEQQPPANPTLFHLRLSLSLLVSLAFNVGMGQYCLQTVLDNPRPGMMVIFTFEFAILAIFSMFTSCRYFLALYESQIVARQTRQKRQELKDEIREERLRVLREAGQDVNTLVEPTDDDVNENEVDVPGWEDKRKWLFGLELAVDFIKIVIYTVFFTISLTFIGLPMHIMRDVYMTISAFTKRVQDYSNYRKATDNMNSRYPDATPQELSNDNTCIVCREEMTVWEQPQQLAGPEQPRRRAVNEGLRAKKLPCGHILHLRCLKAWLERQQACPTCRRPVIPPRIPNQPQLRDAEGNMRPMADIIADARRINGLPQQPQQEIQQQQPGNNQGQGIAPPNAGNRMRWLNMGPIRIGFYNGPAGHVQDALRQQQQTGQPVIANSAINLHNHPGISGLSSQDHLRAVELRLLEQAHNLDVERSQLAHVRALEAELARLRSIRSEAGQMGSTTPATSNSIFSGLPPLPIMASTQNVQAIQRYQHVPSEPTLTNNSTQLPQGLILPEGWTLTPLQRAPQVQNPPQFMPAQFPPFPPGMPFGFPPQMQVHGGQMQFTPNTAPPATSAVSASQPESSTATVAHTDVMPVLSTATIAEPEITAQETVPEQADTTRPAVQMPGTSADPATIEPQPLEHRPVSPPAQNNRGSQLENQAPSSQQQSSSSQQHLSSSKTLPSTWSFDAADEAKQADRTQDQEHSMEDVDDSETVMADGQGQGSSKGKARAVEVEDVKDVDLG